METFGNIWKLNHRDAIKHENVFDLKSAGNNTEAQEFLGRGGQVYQNINIKFMSVLGEHQF